MVREEAQEGGPAHVHGPCPRECIEGGPLRLRPGPRSLTVWLPLPPPPGGKNGRVGFPVPLVAPDAPLPDPVGGRLGVFFRDRPGIRVINEQVATTFVACRGERAATREAPSTFPSIRLLRRAPGVEEAPRFLRSPVISSY